MVPPSSHHAVWELLRSSGTHCFSSFPHPSHGPSPVGSPSEPHSHTCASCLVPPLERAADQGGPFFSTCSRLVLCMCLSFSGRRPHPRGHPPPFRSVPQCPVPLASVADAVALARAAPWRGRALSGPRSLCVSDTPSRRCSGVLLHQVPCQD